MFWFGTEGLVVVVVAIGYLLVCVLLSGLALGG